MLALLLPFASWRLPIEALQDVEAMGGAMEIFKTFAADRIARGVGKKLVNGPAPAPFSDSSPRWLHWASPRRPLLVPLAHWRLRKRREQYRLADIAKLYYSVNEAYRKQLEGGVLHERFEPVRTWRKS